MIVALIARYGVAVVGRIIGAEQDELLTVCFVGLAVLVAGIAEEVHVSDAIGAFMAGLVIAETTVAPRVRKLVLPLRDTFAALFFFTFGLTVDPGDVASVAGPIAIAIVLTVIVNFVAAIIVARRSGLGRVPATNLATTILARGEFSLIIAALGAEAGLDARVVPFVAGYVLILALAAPDPRRAVGSGRPLRAPSPGARPGLIDDGAGGPRARRVRGAAPRRAPTASR